MKKSFIFIFTFLAFAFFAFSLNGVLAKPLLTMGAGAQGSLGAGNNGNVNASTNATFHVQKQARNVSVTNQSEGFHGRLIATQNSSFVQGALKQIKENQSLRFGNVTIHCENCNLTKVQKNITEFKNRTMNQLRNRSNVSGEFNRSVNASLEVNNSTLRIRAKFSNGKQADIKVMPEVAAQKALRALSLHQCTNNCSIVLKQIGSGNSTKLVYQMKANVTAKIFGLFRDKINVRTQVDSETGQIISKNRPWWSFLASWKN